VGDRGLSDHDLWERLFKATQKQNHGNDVNQIPSMSISNSIGTDYIYAKDSKRRKEKIEASVQGSTPPHLIMPGKLIQTEGLIA
jgi:hypothetical protein